MSEIKMNKNTTTSDETKVTSKSKIVEKANRFHADFSKKEVPTCKAEINFQYIFDFCKQDKDKAKWFVDTMNKYEGNKVRHLLVRKEFVDKFYPEFNVAKKRSYKKASTGAKFMAEMDKIINS